MTLQLKSVSLVAMANERGGFDFATTKTIGDNAYRMFIAEQEQDPAVGTSSTLPK